MKRIGLVGPGNLGRTLVMSLPGEIWALGPVLSHSRVSSRRAVREMKKGYDVEHWAELGDVSTVLIATPQQALPGLLAQAAEQLPKLSAKRILITSSACSETREQIAGLQRRGAQVGGLLPIGVYRRPSRISPNTTFAVWGTPPARRAARELVKGMAGNSVVISEGYDKHVLLALAIAAGLIANGLELSVRRLVEAGFARHRAIDALSQLAELVLQEHRKARKGPPPPWFPAECPDLSEALAAVDPAEAAVCKTALRFATEDLR